MSEENKLILHGTWSSPYYKTVELALKLKGIPFEYVEEDLKNKSQKILTYNPVYKKIPVLVHTGKPISESLVIVEYVDETWKNGPPLLPQNPYSRAQVRFWVSFIRDQLYKTMFAVIQTQGEEQEKAVEELLEKLGVLEDGLKEFFPNIGNLSFGNGDMGLLDIAMGVVFGPYRVQEQVAGVKIIDPDKTPLIFSWLNAISKHPVVVDSTPPLDKMVAMLKIFRQNALSSSAT